MDARTPSSSSHRKRLAPAMRHILRRFGVGAQAKPTAPFRVLGKELAAMGLQDGSADGQPQPGAALLGGEKWFGQGLDILPPSPGPGQRPPPPPRPPPRPAIAGCAVVRTRMPPQVRGLAMASQALRIRLDTTCAMPMRSAITPGSSAPSSLLHGQAQPDRVALQQTHGLGHDVVDGA